MQRGCHDVVASFGCGVLGFLRTLRMLGGVEDSKLAKCEAANKNVETRLIASLPIQLNKIVNCQFYIINC